MPSDARPATSTALDVSVVVLVVAAGIAVRVYFGTSGDGIYHPDEIYQILEPAHRIAFGYGLKAWEWEFGARNYLLAGFVAALLRGAAAVGLDSPLAYVDVVRVVTSVMTASTAVGVYLLVREHGTHRWLAWLGAAVFAFTPVAVYLGFHPFSETISTPFVVFGLWLALRSVGDKEHSEAEVYVAMSLIGIAVLMRLQNALFVVPLLLFWRFRGPREQYDRAMKVLVIWALIYGLIDWVTWGIPFQSAGAYLRFNLLMDGTQAFYGGDPFFAYVSSLFESMGTLLVFLLLLPFLAWKRAREMLVCTFVFLIAHSAFPHKDLRFVYTVLPLLAALSVVGLDELLQLASDQWEVPVIYVRAAASVMFLATLAFSAIEIPVLTLGKLGQAETLGAPPETSAYDYRGPTNRLLARTAQREDVCGLYFAADWAVKAGGHTYFHRDVPFFHEGNRPPSPGAANYVVAEAEARPSGEVVDRAGDLVVVRTADSPCDPAGDYRPLIFVPVDDASEAKRTEGGS